jgi:hypothetical protein
LDNGGLPRTLVEGKVRNYEAAPQLPHFPKLWVGCSSHPGDANFLTFSAAAAHCWCDLRSVPGLDDVAMVGRSIEHGGGHLGVTEDLRPIGEGEVCGSSDVSSSSFLIRWLG